MGKRGAAPEVGSSRKTTDGAATMPAAMDRRLRSPPLMPRSERPPGNRPPTCAAWQRLAGRSKQRRRLVGAKAAAALSRQEERGKARGR